LLCDSPQVQDAIGRADAILKAGRAETDRGNVKATEPAPLHPSASLNPHSPDAAANLRAFATIRG
jgi:hypothetical protein